MSICGQKILNEYYISLYTIEYEKETGAKELQTIISLGTKKQEQKIQVFESIPSLSSEANLCTDCPQESRLQSSGVQIAILKLQLLLSVL